jgi:ketosteroid isomerase-like protein
VDCAIYQSSRLPWGGHDQGREGLGAFLGKLTGNIASAVQTEQTINDEEDHVVAVGITRGQVLVTGEAFEIPEAHVWTVENGKSKRFESYIDTGKMRAALGI